MDYTHQRQILRTIVERADRVFLWVVLVLDSLNRAIRSGTASTDEIQERLALTPADLTDLFIDMWQRPGDDSKLSSCKIDASRYSSLVITANRFKKDQAAEYDAHNYDHINSVLILATAIENEPVISIIYKGRSIQAEEREARCLSVANRLRLISRGLLETTSADFRTKGQASLINYNRKSIHFIQRSAYDFITDTQFGRECLSTCQWSLDEQVSRLLAGHLVRSRFLCVVARFNQHSTTRKRNYYTMAEYREYRFHHVPDSPRSLSSPTVGSSGLIDTSTA